MDDEHEYTPEADTQRLLARTERQAARFPVIAFAFLGVLYAVSVVRAEEPLVYLVVGCGVLSGLLGSEILRTKALILRIEYIRMRSLQVKQERQLETLGGEEELLGTTSVRKPESDASV